MRKDVRDRLLLPLLLPIGILAFIALMLWGFSRILLGLTSTTATVTAVAAALGIMVIAAVAAGRTTVRGSTIAAMLGATAGVAMLAGGIALAVVGGGGEGDGEEPLPNGGPPVVELVAQDIAFNPTDLTVPAGEPFEIAFDNRDAGQQHNVAIYDNPEFSGTPVFQGDLVAGPAQATYHVDPLAPGPYSFLCQVHPTMTGQIETVEGAGGGPGGGGGGEPGGGGAVTVVAQNVAFDTQTIALPPDTPSTITFDNRDPGTTHNISIYSDESLGEILFQGDLVTGPATKRYEIPPLPPGEYYFQCDVHPNMNGTVTVG